MMKISVITCTRNSAQWIRDSIRSVDMQQGVQVERIFVDGNSTDDTLDILQQVDGEVTILQGYTNGISNAMNAGARAATGDVIAHLHSDDFYTDPNTLARVADEFHRQPQAQWLYGRCMNVIDNEPFENHFETTPFSRQAILDTNIIPHPATFVKRAFFLSSGGFSEDLKYVMDYDLWLRLAALSTPIQVSDYLAAFRIHDGSLSSTDIWRCHAECLRVRLHHADKNWVEQITHRMRHAKVSLRIVRDLLLKRLGYDLRIVKPSVS